MTEAVPRRWRRALIAVSIFVALTLLLAATNTLRNRAGVAIIDVAPAERMELLQAAWRMVPPDAPVETARALLMSGCDGPHDNMSYWASILSQGGRPSLILDSHSPRGFDDFEMWRLMCAGQILPGAERAGDIAVALTATKSDQVTLLGASHGGWAAMELLDRLATGEVPPGLTEWPDRPETLARRIDRVVLLYPYCGMMNGARGGDWSKLPPILLIAAENDTIVSTPACVALADTLRNLGATIRVEILPDVNHGFDQGERSALSPLRLVPEARSEARREVEAFLANEGAQTSQK